MKKLIALFLMLPLFSLLTACSTVEGVGKDIKKVGSALEKEATKKKTQ